MTETVACIMTGVIALIQTTYWQLAAEMAGLRGWLGAVIDSSEIGQDGVVWLFPVFIFHGGATMNFDELSPEERLIAEQAVVNLRSLNKACDAAADGIVLAVGEKLAVEQGRELIRRTLQATLDAQVESVENKVPRRGLDVD